MKFYLEIFITFFKLGAFGFGGGYAIIPLIEREICDNKKWVEHDRLINIFAISESLPGAIALNASAFVGYAVRGIPGAIVALLGSLVPSVVIMTILITFFLQIKDNVFVQSAFLGIRPAVIALIAYASIKIAKTSIKDLPTILIFAGSLSLCFIHGMSIILIIIAAAAAGIITKALQERWHRNV